MSAATATPMPAADDVELSIVMPCLNEARTLPSCIRKAQQAVREHALRAEIIIADNGSSDGSQQIATELGARVVDVPQRGYGAALLAGIQSARGRFIIMGDADDSYDFSAIWPFVTSLRDGSDLVMGCRLPAGGGTIMNGAMPWKHRWLGNPVLSAIGRLFFRSPVTDFHCGLRGFRREFVLDLDLRTSGMEFASEMVIKATLRQARISEIPITLYRDGRDRPPHLRSWRDGWRHLRFMLLFSPRWLFIVPGAAMFVIGLIASAVLLPAPLHVGHIGFDTSTLLVASMVMILGLQIVVYGLFTRIFAVTEGLLPPDPWMGKAFRYVTLETGLLAGFMTLIGGIALLAYATIRWGEHGFGPIDYSSSQRVVIPAVTAIIVGIQVIFSSFFLSVLGVRRRS